MPILQCKATGAGTSMISPKNIIDSSRRSSLQYSAISASDLADYMDGIRMMESLHSYRYRNTVDVDALASFDDSSLSEMSTNADSTAAEQAAQAEQERYYQEAEAKVHAQPQEGEDTLMDISQSNPNAAASGTLRTKPQPQKQQEDIMNLPPRNPYGFFSGNTAANSSFVIPRPRPVGGNYLQQDPEGLRPLGPQKDPSGKLIHEPSGRLINTASGRLIPEMQLQQQKQQQQQKPKDDDSRTTFATSRTTQSSAGTGPIRRLMVPCSGVESVCPSVLTADTDGLILMAQNGTTHHHPNIRTHKEFLLLVEFHWQSPKGPFGCHWPLTHQLLQPDHPTLPRVLQPYLRPHHWQIFLQAVLKLVYRDHRMGFLYIVLGMLANLAGVAYLFYAMVPIPGHPDKVLNWPIALATGFGLLTGGVCLCVWGRANRGGIIWQQDMDAICANTSHQIKGLTIRFRTEDSLLLQQGNGDNKDIDCHNLAFGLEFFCSDADEEEDPTQSTTHPTNQYASEDLGYIVGDQELPSSSMPPPSSTKAIAPPPSPYKLQRVVSRPMLASSPGEVEVGMV